MRRCLRDVPRRQKKTRGPSWWWVWWSKDAHTGFASILQRAARASGTSSIAAGLLAAVDFTVDFVAPLLTDRRQKITAAPARRAGTARAPDRRRYPIRDYTYRAVCRPGRHLCERRRGSACQRACMPTAQTTRLHLLWPIESRRMHWEDMLCLRWELYRRLSLISSDELNWARPAWARCCADMDRACICPPPFFEVYVLYRSRPHNTVSHVIP